MVHTNATIESLRNNFRAVDYAVFSVFLISSALIGVFFAWRGRNSKNNKEFLTGNRNLPMFPVVMSLAASFMSTNTILGVPAEVYTLGTQFYINMVCFIIAVVLSAEVFMPVFYRLNMTSVNEYLFMRFKSHNARLCGTIAFIMSTVSTQLLFICHDLLSCSCISCHTWVLSFTDRRWLLPQSPPCPSITLFSLLASFARSTRPLVESKQSFGLTFYNVS